MLRIRSNIASEAVRDGVFAKLFYIISPPLHHRPSCIYLQFLEYSRCIFRASLTILSTGFPSSVPGYSFNTPLRLSQPPVHRRCPSSLSFQVYEGRGHVCLYYKSSFLQALTCCCHVIRHSTNIY